MAVWEMLKQRSRENFLFLYIFLGLPLNGGGMCKRHMPSGSSLGSATQMIIFLSMGM